MLQALLWGKRDTDYKLEGRHTEGVWGPGKRKRMLQPPGMSGGVWWTARPTAETSLMVPKRTELGAWGRLSKRSPESSSSQDPQTSMDPRIRIIRGGKDLNQWIRTIKRKAVESGGLIRIVRGGHDLNQQWERIVKRRAADNKVVRTYGRLSKRQSEEEEEAGWKLLRKRAAGKELVKWGRVQKRDNEDIEDEDEEEEGEELEENEEEYDDEVENNEEEFPNESAGIDLIY